MKVINLYSGSSGNSTYIEIDGMRFLVDAGWNAKALCSSLLSIGVSPDSIDRIFVTHEHSDHISALPVFEKKHCVPVVISEVCSGCRTLCDAVPRDRMTVFGSPFSECFGGVKVTSFPVPHDSRECFGYRFDGSEGSLAVITDIGIVTEDVKNAVRGCEYLILESNYDPVMLSKSIYPPDLQSRILSPTGHLSNGDCGDFARELSGSGLKKMLLAHISEHSNTPETAAETVKNRVGPSVTVIPTSHTAPTELV